MWKGWIKMPKKICFTPKHFEMEGVRSQRIMKKIKGSQKAWNSFLKPTFSTLAPFIGITVEAKSKNTHVGQATTNFLKNISAGVFLTLIDIHGH